mmetsp:Transcript_30828/g.92360  ORF Transcript_30828/g.92360 Transcript_30828/m.92360 type:complete len:220 (-) Transcript_30828:2205-2864(-)
MVPSLHVDLLDKNSSRRSALAGNVPHLLPHHDAPRGDDEYLVVLVHDPEAADVIVLVGRLELHGDDAHSPPGGRPKVVRRDALPVPTGRDREDVLGSVLRGGRRRVVVPLLLLRENVHVGDGIALPELHGTDSAAGPAGGPQLLGLEACGHPLGRSDQYVVVVGAYLTPPESIAVLERRGDEAPGRQLLKGGEGSLLDPTPLGREDGVLVLREGRQRED